MSRTDDELVVRAAVTAVAELPTDTVARLGDERTLTLLASASTEAVHRKFVTKPSSDLIRAYVQELKERFPDGADLIKPMVAEGLVRHAFGEEDVLDGMDVEDIRTLLFLLPYAVVSELGIEGDQLDAFVNEVIEASDAPELAL